MKVNRVMCLLRKRGSDGLWRKMALFLFAALTMLFSLSACQESRWPEPEAISDLDRCAVCNMMVPDDYNATQVILKDGRVVKFDDLGCLITWVGENEEAGVAVSYVRDYHSEEWVVLDEATFAYDPSFETAMAYNVLSFKEREVAEQFVAEQGRGELMSAAQLAYHHWEPNHEMQKEHHRHHDEEEGSGDGHDHGHGHRQHGQGDDGGEDGDGAGQH